MSSNNEDPTKVDMGVYSQKFNSLPVLFDFDPKSRPEIAPSVYFNEMQLSTEERLKKLTKSKLKIQTVKVINRELRSFKASPDVVIFQNFSTGVLYTAALTLQNIGKLSKPLRMHCEKSPNFEVSYTTGTLSTRVAPGMAVLFTIKFTADLARDYKHDITFLTDAGTLLVPIYAIGPRPLLDFPDQITVPPGAVNVPSERTVVVRNLGQAAAVFKIKTQNPFSVVPNVGVLAPNETMQLTIVCNSPHSGFLEDKIYVQYETGEELTINVSGQASVSNIGLEQCYLRLPNTYIRLTSNRALLLFNRSSHIAKFKFCQFHSSSVDDEEKLRYKQMFESMCDLEKMYCNKLEHFDIVDCESNQIVEERILSDEIECLKQNEEFLYKDPYFSISPLTGEIFPGNEIEVNVTFVPKAATAYSSTLYCELSGLEHRIQLKLGGFGLGPEMELSVKNLDAGYLFICAKHYYEVVVQNRGGIPGTISYVPDKSVFGATINCEPHSFELGPNVSRAFLIGFVSTKQGQFVEDIRFKIVESEEILTVTIRGKVICPKVQFDEKEMNFGQVSLGVPVTKKMQLCNNSEVPIVFTIRITHDGTEPPLTCEEFSKSTVKPALPNNPKEFVVSPMKASVSSDMCRVLTITLTPNRIGSFRTVIMLDMWDTETESESLTVIWQAYVPEIVCLNTEISILFTFINHPYARSITLQNNSDVEGYFYITPQKPSPDHFILVSTQIQEACIKPNSFVEIPIWIITTALGEQHYTMEILTFGEKRPRYLAGIKTYGNGPVVSLDPEILNFEEVVLLQNVTKDVKITSDSPIPGNYTISLTKKRSPFQISIEKGHVNPEEEQICSVSVFLRDPGDYSDTLVINVENGRIYNCKLKVKGIGTSIRIEPNITPVYDLGSLFTCKRYVFNLVIRNMGSKRHRMLWRNMTEALEGPKKERRTSTVEENQKLTTAISMIPDRIVLQGDESEPLSIVAYNEKVCEIEEFLQLDAAIGESVRRETVIMVKVLAKFEVPVVKFSKEELFFRIDKGVENCFYHIQDTFEILNETTLALHMELHIEEPFFILDSKLGLLKRCHTEIQTGEKQTITIFFQCNNTNCYRSYHIDRKIKLTYKDHHHVDFVYLHANVNFPNIRLSTNLVDFGCVPNGEHCYSIVTMENTSPLTVNYAWKWKESGYKVQYVEPIAIGLENVVDNDAEESELETDSDNALHKAENRIHETLIKMSDRQFSSILTVVDRETLGQSLSEYSMRSNSHDLDYQNLYTMSLSHEIQHNAYYQIKNKVFNMCDRFFEECDMDDITILNLLAESGTKDRFSDTFNVTPFYGVLNPYEKQELTISFHPHTYICIECQLECHIREGPIDTLKIVGMASNLSFHLDKTIIDFGRQVFCEVCSRTVSLSNTGYLGFDFVTSRPAMGETPSVNYLVEAGWMCIEPRMGHIAPRATIDLQIRYFPGIAGRFSESFEIQIGHGNPISVKVNGFGVFPQVYLSLPRKKIPEMSNEIGYSAVASITSAWLEQVHQANQPEYCQTAHYCYPDIPHKERMILINDDWELISLNDTTPSPMDIDLAIERFNAYRHIERHPNILVDHSKLRSKCISNMYASTYQANFGPVIVGTTVHHTIHILNYGPTSANIELMPLSKRTGILNSGIKVQFRNIHNLPVGCRAPFYIIFNPSLETYTARDTKINYFIYLEVEHGARIPIEIDAIVTIPYIHLEPQTLDFHTIKCGECKLLSIIVYNKGYTNVIWSAKIKRLIKPKPKRKEYRPPLTEAEKQLLQAEVFPFRIGNSDSGSLEPDEAYVLHVLYEPLNEGVHEMRIVFNIVGNNREKFIAYLRGAAEEPKLEVSDMVLQWDPILPWTENSCKKFCVKNPCNFSIELYFPEFDSVVHNEENILQSLLYLYGTDKILLPPRAPGQPFWASLIDFHKTLVDEAIKSSKQVKGSQDVSDVVRSARTRRRSGSIISRTKLSASNVTISNDVPKSGLDLNELVKGHIEQIKNENKPSMIHRDPIKLAWREQNESSTDFDGGFNKKEGVFLIFYDAPHTNGIYIANKAAKEFNLVPVNIDHLIVEGLLNIQSAFVTETLALLEQTYEELHIGSASKSSHPNSRTRVDIREEIERDEEFSEEIIADPFGELLNKIIKIKNGKSHSGMHLSEVKNITSSKTNKAKEDEETFLNIPMDELFDLLKQRINSIKPGIVVETLQSIFFSKPLVLFMGLLKIIGLQIGIVEEVGFLLTSILKRNSRYIHLIVFGNWFPLYKEYMIHKSEMEKARVIEAIANRVQQIDYMSAEEFSHLNVEDQRMYREHVLLPRKEANLKRLEKLKAKVMAKLAENAHSKHQKKHHGNSRILPVKINSEELRRQSSAKQKHVEGDQLHEMESEHEMKLLEEMATFERNYLDMIHILEHYDSSNPNLLSGSKDNLQFSTHKRSIRRESVISNKHKKESIVRSLPSETHVHSYVTAGTPVWIIDASKETNPHPDLINQMLYDSILFLEALKKLNKSLRKIPQAVSELFSVAKRQERPPQLKKQEAEFFSIENVEDKLPTHISKESVNSKMTVTEKKKRPDTALVMGSKNKIPPPEPENKFKSRMVLAPGQSVEYNVRFNPMRLGDYSHSYFMEVVGWPKAFPIICSGTCEVPHFDNDCQVMFSNVKPYKDMEPERDVVFYQHIQTLDFASVFIRKPGPDKLKTARIADVNIVNISQMACQVSAIFVNDKDGFDFFPKQLLIEPGGMDKFQIYAIPLNVMTYTDTFAIFVKDNPRVETFRVVTQGAKIDVEVVEKYLVFQKVLLFRKEMKIISFRNKSLVPLLWRFINFQEFQEHGFEFSAIQGVLNPAADTKIGVEYTAYQIEVFDNLVLDVELFDEYGRDVLVKESITFRAESYDVEVDVYYSEPSTTHVNFGDVKVQTLYNQNIGLFNRGKYDVDYRIDIIYNEKLNRKRAMWGLKHPQGVLPPNILVPIVIMVMPKMRIRMHEKPMFQITLQDSETKALIAKFPISVSITSHYAQYEICPSIVDFGIVTLGTEKKLQLTIKNTGKFSFRYFIDRVSVPHMEHPPSMPSASKTKVPVDKKGKTLTENPIVETRNLVAGMFELFDVANEIHPNEIKVINMMCNSNDVGFHEEKLVIFISECIRKYAKSGHICCAKVDIYVPIITHDDFDEMFREMYVGNTLNDVFIPNEIGSHAIFTKNDRTIYFRRICIKKEYTARIRLKNPGMVPSTVTGSFNILKSPGKTQYPPTFADISSFSFSPKALTIAPHSEEAITIHFTPHLIEKYGAGFELHLEQPNGNRTFFDCRIFCEANIPDIKITTPETRSGTGAFFLTYPPTLINQKQSQQISVRNNGFVPSKVLLEICDDALGVFCWEPEPELIQMMKYWNSEEKTNKTLMFKLKNGITTNAYLAFKTSDVGKYTATVKMIIIDNPFENQTILINAESYNDEISLQGLMPQPREVQKVCKPSYVLSFAPAFINELQTYIFKITNHSDAVYKFQFPDHALITFTPNIGHLSGGMSKDIVAGLVAKTVTNINKLVLELKAYQITYPPLDGTGDVLWDSKSTTVTVSPKGKDKITKSVQKASEPGSVIVIPGTEKKIPIEIYATVDYSKYSCTLTEIKFTDTMVLEKRIFSFDLINTGTVPLDIKWNFSFDNQFPCDVVNLMSIETSYKNAARRRLKSAKDLKRLRAKPHGPIDYLKDDKLDSSDEKRPQSALQFARTYNKEVIPFEITPEDIVISPGSRKTFDVSFEPFEVSQQSVYLQSDIKNLPPTMENISIRITGNGLMPYCHFDTEFSDFVTSGRRNPKLASLIGEWKVIELDVLGLQRPTSREFKILNPCGEDLVYSWHRLNRAQITETEINQFYCHKPTGTIEKNRYDVAEFSFFPTKLGVFEEMFIFDIETFNWQSNFLLVANVHEANVYFLNSVVKMKPTVIGIDVSDEIVIKNEENERLEFEFVEDSLYTQGRQQKIDLEKENGIISAKSSCTIGVKFHPTKSGETTFDLVCNVEGIIKPLKIPVSTFCYTIEPRVFCERVGWSQEEITFESIYHIQQNKMFQNETVAILFHLSNTGRTKYYYVWNFDPIPLEDKFTITIEYDKGNVQTGKTETCQMNITPIDRTTLSDFSVFLEIAFGPTYQIKLDLSSVQPQYKFSCYKLDFGRCFIRKEPIWFYKKTLEFENRDIDIQTLECFFKDTPYLRINCDIASVQPREKVIIEVLFQPREEFHFEEKIVFSINSFLQEIVVSGDGIELFIDLVDPNDTIVDFGLVPVNQTSIKTICVRNNSLDPATILIDLYEKLPFVLEKKIAPAPPRIGFQDFDDRHKERVSLLKSKSETLKGHSTSLMISKTKMAESKAAFSQHGLSIVETIDTHCTKTMINKAEVLESLSVHPNHPVTIPSQHDLTVKLKFAPKICTKLFQEKVAVQMYGDVETICIVKGATVGAHYCLDRYAIPFGIAMQDCTVEATFLLQNKGDIGARFLWEFSKKSLHFSLSPMEGYISPGMDVNHVAKFCPRNTTPCLLLAEAICKIENYHNQILIMSGRCEELPPPKQTISFNCPVRTSQEKHIGLFNKSKSVWNLVPIVNGDYFTATESIKMQPNSEVQCEITYKPMKMTKNKEHTGFVLFKLPGGIAELYSLTGTSEHPIALEDIFISVPCKVKHEQSLVVKNWLPDTQQFTVITEQFHVEPNQPLYKANGRDLIEVQGNAEKSYTWSIYVYSHGILHFKVIFINAETGEYMYYTIEVVVTPCLSLDTLSFSTRVRIPVQHEIMIENPLDRLCTFSSTCTNSCIKVSPVFSIPAFGKVQLDVQYLPMIAGVVIAQLELKEATLGTYLYTLNLEALPPVPEALMRFETFLGKSDMQMASIHNVMKVKVDFSLTSSVPNVFLCDKSIGIQPESTGNFEIVFEPNEIGNVSGTITANSNVGGQFVFPLLGVCSAPKPQGPFKISPGGTVTVTFKNILPEDCTFNYLVEPANVFSIKPTSEIIKVKTEKKPVVTMVKTLTLTDSLRYPLTGRVTIVPQKTQFSNLKWVYYLIAED